MWSNRKEASGIPFDHLGHGHFALTLAAAVALHLGAMYLWQLMPAAPVTDIPVRPLAIKLGDSRSLAERQQPVQPPEAVNKDPVETALVDAVHDPNAAAPVQSEPAAAATEPVTPAAAPESARQFVRASALKAPGGRAAGSEIGNSAANNAELMSRYEQLISLWIEKFKLYPEEARLQGLEGGTVVRVRIDRQGTIRYYTLERSTGHPALDRAAIEMIRRANPVPAVPRDYPPGDLIEFLIPVNFNLQ